MGLLRCSVTKSCLSPERGLLLPGKENVLFIKKSFHDRITALCNVIINSSNIIDSVTATFSFFEKIQAISVCAIRWIPIVNCISFFVGFLSLKVTTSTLRESISLWKMFSVAKKRFAFSKGDVERAHVLVNVFCDIQSRGVTRTRKKIFFSKEAGLEDSIHELTNRLLTSEGDLRTQTVAESEKKVSVLSQMAAKEFSFSIAYVALKIVGLIGSGLLFFPPTTVVGIVIVTINAVATCAIRLIKLYCVNRNPFDPQSTSKAYAFYQHIRSLTLRTLIWGNEFKQSF